MITDYNHNSDLQSNDSTSFMEKVQQTPYQLMSYKEKNDIINKATLQNIETNYPKLADTYNTIYPWIKPLNPLNTIGVSISFCALLGLIITHQAVLLHFFNSKFDQAFKIGNNSRNKLNNYLVRGAILFILIDYVNDDNDCKGPITNFTKNYYKKGLLSVIPYPANIGRLFSFSVGNPGNKNLTEQALQELYKKNSIEWLDIKNEDVKNLFLALNLTNKQTYYNYKQTLKMIFAALQGQNTQLYLKSYSNLRTLLKAILNIKGPITDKNYYLKILSLTIFKDDCLIESESSQNQNYFSNVNCQLPKFTEIQQAQIESYLEEHNNILMLMAILNEKNNKGNLDYIFGNLITTITINKSPQLFWDKPMSNHTFGLLISYLNTVTLTYNNQFVKEFNHLYKPQGKNNDKP